MSHLKWLSSRWSWNILLFAIFFQAILVTGKPKAKEVKDDGIFTNTTAITSFSPGGQYVMLTFDGGPRSVLTTKILDILHENYAKATFFVQGSKAYEHPNVIRRMSDEGHEVGNRGYTGRAFSALPANTIMSNVMETSDILHNITGFWPKIIRPPFGVTTDNINKNIEYISEMKTVLWNFDPSRLHGKKPKLSPKDNTDSGTLIPEMMVKNIVDNVQVGDILYFSEGNVDVVIALPDIIKSLHKQGFELLTISAMMSYPDDKPH